MNPADWFKPLEMLRDTLFKPVGLITISLAGTLLLFLPSPYLDHLGLTSLRDTYRPWIALVAGIALVSCVVQLGIDAWHWVRLQFRLKRSRAESLQYLDSLSPEEAFILIACVVRNRRTITLTFQDPVASSLREKGLLEAARIGTLLRHPHIVPRFVWKRLKSKPPQWLPTDPAQLEDLHRAADGYFGDDMPSLR